VKAAVREVLPDAEVLLYGSVARGTEGPERDYDVLVISPTPLATRQAEAVWDAVLEVELGSGAVISAHLCSQDGWTANQAMPFYDRVQRDGIVL